MDKQRQNWVQVKEMQPRGFKQAETGKPLPNCLRVGLRLTDVAESTLQGQHGLQHCKSLQQCGSADSMGSVWD